MKAVFDHKQRINHDVYSFWFKPEQKIDFISGQYADITIQSNNKNLTQTFTLSSSPNDELISITTKVHKPYSSFKKALQHLKINDKVNIGSVMGDFVLPIDETVESVFISGGIGITPLLSIVKDLKQSNKQRRISIIHAIKNTDDFISPSLFNGFNYTPVISRPEKSWKGHQGKLDLKKIEYIMPITNDMMYFVSGPQPMVENIVKEIKDRFPDVQVVMDYFPGYLDI